MSPMQIINLMQPIATACVVDPEQLRMADGGWRMEPAPTNPQSEIRNPQSEDLTRELQEQRNKLARLLETVNGVAAGLHRSYEQMLASNHGEIAKLAVEIARKILMYKAGKGDYEIQAIVEEALQQAPTRQNVVVRLHPEDLPRCQQLQRENPQSPLAELEFTADGSLGRGECLVQTPKGIVQSFIEEHLERISGALQKVQ
ncbi:MAG: FliH/SctL family protein [Phycisphaerae bacterium]|nr:FliH/SctL family protein [Phycisphaerae bacterium]